MNKIRQLLLDKSRILSKPNNALKPLKQNQRTHFEKLPFHIIFLHDHHHIHFIWGNYILFLCGFIISFHLYFLLCHRGLCSRKVAHPALSLLNRGSNCQTVHRGLQSCDRIPQRPFCSYQSFLQQIQKCHNSLDQRRN